jgi:uncharacterized protein DUF481
MTSRAKYGLALSLLFVTGILSLSAQAVRADQVFLKNGDQITGTITQEGGGTMTIATALFGDVTVQMSDVKTFSTDEPVKVQLSDGTVLNEKIDQGKDGEVMTAAGGAILPQSVPLSDVEKINPPPVRWTGALVLNALYNRAMETTTSFGAQLNAVRRSDDDRITFGAAYQFASQRIAGVQTTTTDNWFIALKYDLFLTQQFYADVFGRVEKDRINFLDLRLTPGAGVGYQWVEKPTMNFDTEAGLAWVYQDYTTEPTPSEQFSARVAYHFDVTLFNSSVKFFSDEQFYPSIQEVSNFLSLFDAGFRVMLTKSMFSEIRAEWDYNSQTAPGSARNTQLYTLGVGWTF